MEFLEWLASAPVDGYKLTLSLVGAMVVAMVIIVITNRG